MFDFSDWPTVLGWCLTGLGGVVIALRSLTWNRPSKAEALRLARPSAIKDPQAWQANVDTDWGE